MCVLRAGGCELADLAEDILVVCREGLGAVDEGVDLSVLETRDSVGSAVPDLHEVIVVVGQQTELEVRRHP